MRWLRLQSPGAIQPETDAFLNRASTPRFGQRAATSQPGSPVPGGAAAPPVPDEEVGEEGPFGPGDDLHEGFLDLPGIGLADEAEAVREPGHVGVDDDAFLDPKALPRTTFAVFRPTPARETSSSIVRGTSPPNFSARARPQSRRFFAFARKRPIRRRSLLQGAGRGGGVVGGGAVLAEEVGGDAVDERVGALGGEDRGDEELQRAGVVELARRSGIGGAETGEDRGGPLQEGWGRGGHRRRSSSPRASCPPRAGRGRGRRAPPSPSP